MTLASVRSLFNLALFVGLTSFCATSVIAATESDHMITKQPVNLSVTEGDDATFSIETEGALFFQWRRNEQRLPNGSSKVLKLSNVTEADAGEYYCLVMNYGVWEKTRKVTLNVSPKADGAARISWQAPRYRESGAALSTDTIAEYKIYRHVGTQKFVEGTTYGEETSYLVTGLSSGNHLFSLATVDASGLESEPSDVFTVLVD